MGFTGAHLGLVCCGSGMEHPCKGVSPMGIPWLLHGTLGVVPRGGHSGLPFAGGHISVKPALPNEDPTLIQGPLPQIGGTPPGKYLFPCGWLPLPGSRHSAVPTCGNYFPNLLVWFDTCVDGVHEAISGLVAAPPV